MQSIQLLSNNNLIVAMNLNLKDIVPVQVCMREFLMLIIGFLHGLEEWKDDSSEERSWSWSDPLRNCPPSATLSTIAAGVDKACSTAL